jgi:hypothetical protein
MEQKNDGGWYATGYVMWSFRDYWWWNQKPFVVHGVVVANEMKTERKFENLHEKMQSTLKMMFY